MTLEPILKVSAATEIVDYLRERGRAFKAEAEKMRRDARELEVRASERYDAFISFDLAADKLASTIAEATQPALLNMETK